MSLTDRRIILICGKGGVGRTTLAASIAQTSAKRGRRTLLVEVGDANGGHSPLAKIFDRNRLTHIPNQWDAHLRSCHLFAPFGHEMFLRAHLRGGALIGAALRSKALRSFLTAAPSLLEMGWFYHLLMLLNNKRPDGTLEHETLVLDMPATGHALALTSLPEILLRVIQKGPVVKALQEGQAYLNDPKTTSAWIVALPETLPVTEAIELARHMQDSHVPFGGYILNRFLQDPFSTDERKGLEALMQQTPMYGGRMVYRTERAQVAQRRLYATGANVITIADQVQSGRALLDAIVAKCDMPTGLQHAQA